MEPSSTWLLVALALSTSYEIEGRQWEFHREGSISASECRPGEFQCSNALCLEMEKVCDGFNGCGDFSDEIDCKIPNHEKLVGKKSGQGTASTGDRDYSYQYTPPAADYNWQEAANYPAMENNVDEICGTALAGTIFNGQQASPGAFPWVVKLNVTFPGIARENCGGTLISNQFVLTAAHCFHLPRNQASSVSVLVILGRHNLNYRAEGIEVMGKQVFEHPEYSSDNYWFNDFALIKLNRPVTFTQTIRPICLPDKLCDFSGRQPNMVDQCQKLTIAGWGGSGARRRESRLRYTPIIIGPRRECNKALHVRLTGSHICMKDAIGSSCTGDSGGGGTCLVNGRNYLIGIVSWGSNGCFLSHTVHSRVCVALPWVRQILNTFG